MIQIVSQVERPDGRVELLDTARVERSALYNEDLAPVPIARRTWTTYNYAALWISMAHCIPTYMLSAGLMAAGMSWAQALFTVALGNTIVLVPDPAELASRARAMAFPFRFSRARPTARSARTCRRLCARSSRADGSASRRGSAARRSTRSSPASSPAGTTCSAPGSAATRRPSGSSFLLFWALNVAIVYRGMDLLRKVENWAAPFVLVMTALLLGVGGDRGERVRSAALAARQVHTLARVPAGVRPVADGHDRLLGDAVAQHARLHALRPQPARAGDRSGRSRCRRRCSCSRRWAC